MKNFLNMIFMLLFIGLMVQSLFAKDVPKVSIELHHANVADAIRLFAKFLNINVILSDEISGEVNLSLHEVSREQAFNLLLASQKLASLNQGNVKIVAPYQELIEQTKALLAFQEIEMQSSSLVMKSWYIKHALMQDIVKFIKEEQHALLSKRGKLYVDEKTNLICVEDIEKRIAMIDHLIKKIDVPQKQILIEARLVSIDTDLERDLGLIFSLHPEGGGHREESVYHLALAKLAKGNLLDVKLRALEKSGQAELISSPSLFAMNQETASIEAGEEVPYQEVSESGGTAVTFKKAVLGLEVTPQILTHQRVKLKLHINQDRTSGRTILGVPSISTRQLTTDVILKHGQTLVLGGIYEWDEEKGIERLPFVHQLPVVGYLLSNHRHHRSKRELLIFVKPIIMTEGP